MTGPATWESTTLGALGRYINGRGFKKEEWRTAGRPIIRIQNLTGSSGVFNYFDGEADERHVVRSGDLLVSWAATLGAYFWSGPEAVLNQHIFKVESNIDPKFHKYLLDYKFDELMRHTHGSGMVHITRGAFDSIPVEIPPLDEQRYIVNILEDHLSRLDAAQTLMTDNLKRLNALRDAALAEAVASAKAWTDGETFTLGEISRVGSGMTPLKSNKSFYNGGTIPWITSGDLHRGVIEHATQFVTPKALDETSLKLVAPGALLIAMYGEGKTRGTAAELAIEATTNQACATVVLHDPTLRPWVRLVLDANYTALRRLAAGGVQPNLNLSVVRSIEIPLPPEEARDTLRNRVAEVGEACAKMRVSLVAAQRRAANLRHSLLSAAFAGRLTSATGELSAVEETIPA